MLNFAALKTPTKCLFISTDEQKVSGPAKGFYHALNSMFIAKFSSQI